MIPLPRTLLTVLCTGALVALAGCGSSSDDGDSSPSSAARPAGAVGMKDIKFNPDTITVKVGQTVTWTDEESTPHDVVAKSGATFKSEVFGKGKTYTFTPTAVGTITYVCTLHPGMDGTIVVTAK